MGKGCVRFKKLKDLALDVVGRTMRATLGSNLIGKRYAKREEVGSVLTLDIFQQGRPTRRMSIVRTDPFSLF
jgi:hypothetical protein